MNQDYSLLAEFGYDLVNVDRGYTNRTLYVNLSDNTIASKPVTDIMKDVFIGGRGFGLWLLWHGIGDDTQWDDPENEIVISSGPIGGITQYPGSGKSIVVTISPTTQCVVDSNVGGHFGPYLKFAGWDAIEVQGKADQDVIVYIDGVEGKVSIMEAPFEAVDTHILAEELVGIFADSEREKRNISSVTAGLGADHTLIGCLNVSLYDPRRQHIRIKQAGRGGTGTVFRDKKIKALVVKSPPVKGDSNRPADLARITRVGRKMNKEVHEQDPLQNSMRTKGTSMLVDIIDYNDLLPVNNFQYGSHPDTHKVAGDFWEKRFAQNLPDGCWYGCTVSCSHTAEGYVIQTGPYQGQKSYVDGPEYETIAGVGSNCGIFDPDAILELNFYCDTYGVDTISFGTLTAFIMECYEAGILNKEITGGLELSFGNAEASMELLHQMGRGEGFGKIAGLGIRRMKRIFAEQYEADPQFLQDIGMEAKGMEYSEYVTKESLAQQGGYGLANKGAQHDEAWLIFMDIAHNSIPTFEDKAEALHYFPMFRTWFGLNGLCKLPWNDVEPADNRKLYDGIESAKVPEHVENYVDLFVGVTGRTEVKSGEDLVRMSEAVYNFQRVFNLRLGFGTREHDAIPYRSVGPVTVKEYESRLERYDMQLKGLVGFDPSGKTTQEKMAALRAYREEQYQKLVDAVYRRRGWTPSGVPRLETLERLKIDVPEVVELVRSVGGG
jgi:aldehyde:ferredoxin oxidoreductase